MVRASALLFLLTSLFLFQNKAAAYPNYISYGYQSCLSCHFNPYGHGPLTDYGRSVGATVISDRLFWDSKASEEKIAEQSDFYMGKTDYPKKSTFRPSASYRGLYLERNVNKKKAKEEDYIIMDLSIAAAMTFLDDKMVVVGQVGYAPTPISQASSGEHYDKYRSREHYIGYRLDKELGIYVGLMDKIYGIRIPDHTAFSRALTNNNQNDQVHGLLVNYSSEPIEIGLQLFLGNLVQSEDLRQRGNAIQVDYNLGKYSRVGISALGSFSDYLDVKAIAGMLRVGNGKGNSVMLELGQIDKTIVDLEPTKSYYMFMQNHLNFRRGLYGVTTVEALQPNIDTKDYTLRFGPGIQWFPFQRLEYRVDFYNTKNYGEAASSDTWYLANQIHLWF